MTLREQYERDGFLVIDTEVPDATIEAAKMARGPEQPAIYSYNPNGGHRWFETWKTSQAVRDIAYAPKVIEAIREITGVEPLAYQGILFDRPSAQPLHADAVHLATIPHGKQIGCWVALEDMDENNGPLAYVPGTHATPFPGWQAMGFHAVPVGEQEEQYRIYEARCAVENHRRVPFICRKGQAFLWGMDMLHGGMPIKDPSRTRWSLVTHYWLPPCIGIAPMFGTPEKPYVKSGRWFDKEGKQHHLEEVSS